MYIPGLGERVFRASAALGAPATVPLFTIAGGVILMTFFMGRVTPTLMDATASTLAFQHSVGNTALCGNLAAIADDAIETIYTISGDFADLAYKAEGAVNGAIRGGMNGGLAAGGAAQVIANGILCIPGTIDEIHSGDQDGTVEWTLCYLPITQGATVVAT